jgi:hypothetical protein
MRTVDNSLYKVLEDCICTIDLNVCAARIYLMYFIDEIIELYE